ncbi:MAG: hypothetical protein ACOYKA_02115 [Legionellaceae bacterium]
MWSSLGYIKSYINYMRKDAPPGILGMGSPYYNNNSILDKLSTKERNRRLMQYQESLSLKNFKQVDHYTAYVEAQKKGLEGILDPLPPELTAERPAATRIKNSLAILDDCTAEIGARFNPDNLKTYLQDDQKNTIDAIKIDHVEELRLLNVAMTTQGIAEAEQVKKRAALKELQDKNLAELQKKFNDDLIRIHQAAQIERDRVAVLATLRELDKSLVSSLDQLYQAKNPDPGTRVHAVLGNEGDKLKNIDIKDLTQFKTLSGSVISIDPKTKELKMAIQNKGSWLDPRSWALFRMSDPRDHVRVDCLTFALAYKASSTDKTVNLNVNDKDPKRATFVARRLYESFLEAGYSADQITKIMVNGKEMKITGADPEKKEVSLYPEGTESAYTRAKLAEKDRYGIDNMKATREQMDALRSSKPIPAPAAPAAPPPAADGVVMGGGAP